MLVTSDGRRVLPEDDAFFVTLRDLAPGQEAVGFAVRNLGFIKFQALDWGVTLIELHPQSVDRRALLAAERRIGEWGTRMFLVNRLDDGKPSRIAISAGRRSPRCVRCAPRRRNPSRPSASFAEPQDFAKLLRSPDHPLADDPEMVRGFRRVR